jgi:hypothetical protein
MGDQDPPVRGEGASASCRRSWAVIDELYPEKCCIGGKIRAVPWLKEHLEVPVTERAVREVE